MFQLPFLWVLALSPLLLVLLGLLLFVYSFFSGTVVRVLAIVLVIIGVLDLYFNVNVFRMLGLA
jgi:hypothetical protein